LNQTTAGVAVTGMTPSERNDQVKPEALGYSRNRC